MAIMHTDGRRTAAAKAVAFLAVLSVLATAHGAAAGMGTPLPGKKPRDFITAPAAFHQPVEISGAVPLPARKPDFGTPDTMALLSFGKAPVPKPRPVPAAGAGLSEKNADLYRRIFAHQAKAEWDKADALLAQITDFRLRGYVLQQRFLHPTAYKASFNELLGWLDLYSDLPEAPRIHKMAMARMPGDFTGKIATPVKGNRFGGMLGVLADGEKPYVSPKTRSQAQREDIKALEKLVRTSLSAGGPAAALKTLKSAPAAKLLDQAEYDRIQARIAHSFLLADKVDKALSLSQESVRRSGGKAPLAGWTGGLAAWRKGDYKLSAKLFENAAASPYNSDWTAAASAYWASRALMRAGYVTKVTPWLERAASYPRTFYGLIATRSLGWDFDFNWTMPEYTAAHKAQLRAIPAMRRAELLVAAGQQHLAEAELARLGADADAAPEAVLAYAHDKGLPALAMQIGQGLRHPSGGLYDAALYPMCPWEPRGGYKVDRALIMALIRQESRFNPAAESPSGASGLMQLMPATASYVAKSRYKGSEGKYSLKDPQVNLDIGQRYVENLLQAGPVEDELFSLVTAYNAGPGNLATWKKKNGAMRDDPLLFIETIPLAETRNFVERVMANYWIYRLRFEQPTPSLDAVAEGRWARYASLDATSPPQTQAPYRVANGGL